MLCTSRRREEEEPEGIGPGDWEDSTETAGRRGDGRALPGPLPCLHSSEPFR